jgi:integrase/recombinase XerD
LRHSFAVHTLVRWYRDGQDVAALLPRLSTYLGHRSPVSTYWYLSAAPELLALAANRLENAEEERR